MTLLTMNMTLSGPSGIALILIFCFRSVFSCSETYKYNRTLKKYIVVIQSKIQNSLYGRLQIEQKAYIEKQTIYLFMKTRFRNPYIILTLVKLDLNEKITLASRSQNSVAVVSIVLIWNINILVRVSGLSSQAVRLCIPDNASKRRAALECSLQAREANEFKYLRVGAVVIPGLEIVYPQSFLIRRAL